MKTLPFLLLLLAGIGFLQCSEEESSETAVVASKSCTLAIEGMMCEKGCKSAIQNMLRERIGVITADVDYPSEKAIIVYDANKTSTDELIEAIDTFAEGIYGAKLVEDKAIEIESEDVEETPDQISV